MNRWYAYKINSYYYNFKTKEWQRSFTPECITDNFEEAYRLEKWNEYVTVYKI